MLLRSARRVCVQVVVFLRADDGCVCIKDGAAVCRAAAFGRAQKRRRPRPAVPGLPCAAGSIRFAGFRRGVRQQRAALFLNIGRVSIGRGCEKKLLVLLDLVD